MSLIVLSILTLTACSKCEPKIVYRDRPYEVKVPIKCVVPKTECDFNRTTNTEVISSLLECIIELKNNSEMCK